MRRQNRQEEIKDKTENEEIISLKDNKLRKKCYIFYISVRMSWEREFNKEWVERSVDIELQVVVEVEAEVVVNDEEILGEWSRNLGAFLVFPLGLEISQPIAL